MKKIFMIFFKVLVVFFIFGLCSHKEIAMAKENDSSVNLKTDGYFKPSDEASYDFAIKNNGSEKYYLGSLSFTNEVINDIDSGTQYSFEEADKNNLLTPYSAILSLNDEKYGDQVLFKGAIKDLVDKKIEMPIQIPLEKGDETKFNITISMDPLAGNDYQNKHYEFKLTPDFYKVTIDVGGNEEDNNHKDKVPDNDNPKKDEDNKDNGNNENPKKEEEIVVSNDKGNNGDNTHYYVTDDKKYNNNNNLVDKFSKFFKTGQDMTIAIICQIVFIVCLFIIVLRIRLNHNENKRGKVNEK